MKKLAFILLIPFLSCSGGQSNKADNVVDSTLLTTYPIKPLVIENGEEDGWGADIKLSVIETIPSDSFTLYKTESSYNGKNIGLNILFPNKSELSESLTITSAGEISDNFLNTLTALYKLKADTSKKFIDSVKISCIDLGKFGESLGGKPSVSDTKEMKIFFESDSDEAELYLNLNDKEHWIEIKEKDEEYRNEVISALTKKNK